MEQPISKRPLVSDEHFVLLCLDLANWREGDVPDAANVAFKRVTSDTADWSLRWAAIRLDPTIAVDPRALELGAAMRDVLGRAIRRRDLAVLRKRRDAALEHVQVATMRLHIESDVLTHEHGYVAGTGDGPVGLVLAFVLDPARRFSRELRRCQLDACGRFFLVPTGRKGGPIQDYCPGTDHQRQADRVRARARAKRARPGKSTR